LSSVPGCALRSASLPASASAGPALPLSSSVNALRGHAGCSRDKSAGPARASSACSGRSAKGASSARAETGISATLAEAVASMRSSVPPSCSRTRAG
jgi:hypothetical protein